jgi:hypothetical protein
LSTAIAEREWERAVSFALQLKKSIESSRQDSKQMESAMDLLESLATAITAELTNPTCKDAQKAKLVSLLTQLGFVDKAQTLFFANHSRWIDIEIRSVVLSG